MNTTQQLLEAAKTGKNGVYFSTVVNGKKVACSAHKCGKQSFYIDDRAASQSRMHSFLDEAGQ